MSFPLLARPFQLAYVTNDVDRAAAVLRERCGAGEFRVMRDLPDAGGAGTVTIALGYAGTLNLELIQPGPGGRPLYADLLAGRDGFCMRFHHAGILVADDARWAAMRERVAASGWAVAWEGSAPGSADFLYVDAWNDLGHYLEYVRLHEGGRAMFADVPGYPGPPGATMEPL